MVRTIAAISFVYDVTAGLTLLLFPGVLQTWFNVPAAQPPIYVTLNGIFLLSVGVGYLLPYREPVRYRAYLWVFGVGLKTAGALAFGLDYMWRDSPASLLLFALCDGVLATLTVAALTLPLSRTKN